MVAAPKRARQRGVALVATASAVAIAAAACNALNGGRDRVLDTDDADGLPTRLDGGDAGADATTAPDGSTGVDAAPDAIEIPVSLQFTTLNGATWTTTDAGTTITAYDAGATHPVIIPLPQPNIPSEDFTILATVLTPSDKPAAEFGILTRIQPDLHAVVFGSEFGMQPQPFLGTIGPPDWNPSNDARGLQYVYTPGDRYKLKVRASANVITAKIWDVKTPEPSDKDAAAVLASAFTTGRGIGFYTYDINGAVLESMTVTVP